MNWRHLEYLRLVVEQGSFAAAARRAGVSQPAVSQALRQLQAGLTAPLFVRQGRRSVPTPFARQLAADLAGLAQHAALIGQAPRPAQRHVLRAGLTPTAALLCSSVLHEAWCAGHPGRVLQLATADEGRLLQGLQRQELDLVVAARPRGDLPHGLVGEPLYRLQPQVYARRQHPAQGVTALAELGAHAWARVEPHVRGPVDVLAEALRVRGLPPARVTVECPDYATLLALLPHADLLAVLPHPALLTREQTRQLSALRLRERLPLYEAWLLRPATRRRSTDRVVEHLRAARLDLWAE